MSLENHEILNPEEIRVLGVLIEKSKTTPDYYPMTLNSITVACNQKTSRKPVVDYSEETVMLALNSLKGRSLVATAVGGTSRTIKYKHNFTTVFPVSDAQLAIMCLLFLRGAQTPGELNTNSGRLYEFASLEEVLNVLQQLTEFNPPFVKELARRAGQKETRYIHLFSEMPDNDLTETEATVTNSAGSLEARLAAVEQELAEVKETLAKITKELF